MHISGASCSPSVDSNPALSLICGGRPGARWLVEGKLNTLQQGMLRAERAGSKEGWPSSRLGKQAGSQWDEVEGEVQGKAWGVNQMLEQSWEVRKHGVCKER